MNLFDPTSPSYQRNNCRYNTREADSGFLSLNSSASTSLYASQSKTAQWSPNCLLLGDALTYKLLRSENRRVALDESLRRAYSALEHQRRFLQDHNYGLQTNDTRIETLLQRQKFLESKISNLQTKNIYCNDAIQNQMNDKEDQDFQKQFLTSQESQNSRITALEREINNIKKLTNYVPIKTNNDSLRFGRWAEQKDYMKEMQENLRQYAEEMATKCNNAEQEKDALELQITSLHSGLLQAKMDSKGLQKECVKLQSQLLANRNINESLHLEVSSLKQLMQKLENSIKGSECENKSLNLQVQNLEREKQCLLSQKEMLFGILQRSKTGKTHSADNQSKRTNGEILIPANKERVSREDTNVNTFASGSMESFIENSSQSSSRTSSKKSKRLKQNRDIHSGKGNMNNGVSWNTDLSTPRSMACQKLENILQAEHESSSQSEVYCCRPDQISILSKGSEENMRFIAACHQHLADLLLQLECLLKSNTRLNKEKAEIVKYLLGMLKELKDAKNVTEKSRKDVEELLTEHITWRTDCLKRDNQITAVVIELKHLKQAYHGIIKHSDDPDDKKAILWISRVQAIKDSLKNLAIQEQKTKDMKDCLLRNNIKSEE
ncbi:uncharacterized protein LOC121393317 [Xenopus laevis]|uniref:Uncharacterized protein n=2 Tax=Xenopus laevis TaxID=8355 RepID=A0A974DY74_XENLA|nr:uncharacterized protein LOC121393317 [Xenopus laevis]OCU00405.1 hypothetical protein XELAEV_18006179mg [Xenopus laevis]